MPTDEDVFVATLKKVRGFGFVGREHHDGDGQLDGLSYTRVWKGVAETLYVHDVDEATLLRSAGGVVEIVAQGTVAEVFAVIWAGNKELS